MKPSIVLKLITVFISAVLAVPRPADSPGVSELDGTPAGEQVHTKVTKHLRLEKRGKTVNTQFTRDPTASEHTIVGGTNPELDRQNPHTFDPPDTDHGAVVNFKWAFSLSQTYLKDGGWVREQLVTDLPPSKDMSAAQEYLQKGAIRELHWHRVAEWGIVLEGEIMVSAVDENGHNTAFTAPQWDIWYFPKGMPHSLQGLKEHNQVLLVFDDGNFEATGTSFNVVDWLLHTPPDVLAKNFGLHKDAFPKLPSKTPYLIPGNITNGTMKAPSAPHGRLKGATDYWYPLSQIGFEEVPGKGGSLAVIDSTNFPVAKTLAANVVKVKAGGLRELHWNTNGDEWLYFHSGNARATVFLGGGLARTFDFSAGDTAVFPDNSGHYIENSGKGELVFIEMFKSDRVADVSLSQWLALTPPDVVAQLLNVSREFVDSLSKFKEKQIIVDILS
ncbi:oxalate decarboxylase [Kalaharituber pfeilii]|nr:oxalate decarboxylase [Kalaharituber pfeilii]